MSRFSYFQLCDQVRREDNGKQLMIGVYRKAIYFPKLPAKLTSLTVIPVLRCTLDDIPNEVFFRLKVPGTQDRDSKVIKIDKEKATANASDPEVQFVDFSQTWGIAPCDFPEPGRIKLIAIADGQEYPAGSFKVAEIAPQAMEPDDLTILANYKKIGTKEAKEASNHLINLVGMINLETPEVQKFLENLVMTVRIGPNKFAAYSAQPMPHWKPEQINGLPPNANVTFEKTHQFYSIFTIDADPALLNDIIADRPKI